MQLLSANQIHQWDAFTIEHEQIASIDLMERAAHACTNFIFEHNYNEQVIKIFCAKGNNGGDGLAIARQLIEAGTEPSVYILEFGAPGTEDFQMNLHRLHQLTKNIHFIQAEEFFPPIEQSDIIIDALYGSGLNRPLKDLSAALVEYINYCGAIILSIDVPSGMFIDKSSAGNIVIKASHTLSFEATKICFLFAENAEYFGEVTILNIGLHHDFLKKIETVYSIVSKKDIAKNIQARKKFSHKGNYGHSLLVAGSKGKIGAAVLAAKACLRAGTGLLTVHVPLIGLNVVQSSISEAMCITEDEEIDFTKYSAIGVGPGIGTTTASATLVENILHAYRSPMVIDADALNIISGKKDLLNAIPPDSILTPHPKEFERLFGKTNNDFERAQLAIDVSKQYNFIIVLKGHYTLIAYNGKGIFNTTGNAAMATGGSGDVLTGIVTSLLAQGYNPLQAALSGVYIHGYAGDLAISLLSTNILLASEIAEYIGQSLYALTHSE